MPTCFTLSCFYEFLFTSFPFQSLQAASVVSSGSTLSAALLAVPPLLGSGVVPAVLEIETARLSLMSGTSDSDLNSAAVVLAHALSDHKTPAVVKIMMSFFSPFRHAVVFR